MPFADTDRGSSQYHPAGYLNYSVATIDTLDTRNGIYSKAGYNMTDKDSRWWCLFTPGEGLFYQKYPDATTFKDWLHIFRYAETLLNLSECYYNTNQPGKAIAALKEVRRRSISADADPIDIDALSGDALKEAIYLERRAELVGEAIRATDIKRRCETFVKKKGTAAEFSCDPNSSGYTWPIPTVETANNKAIVE